MQIQSKMCSHLQPCLFLQKLHFLVQGKCEIGGLPDHVLHQFGTHYFGNFFIFYFEHLFSSYRNCTFSFKEDVKERACQILPPNHVLNQLASQITSRIMILCNCQRVYNSIVIIKILFNATNSQSHSTKKHPLKKMWHHGTGWLV